MSNESPRAGRRPGPSPETPLRFGTFACTEKLGAGGMGEVWKAYDTRLGRWVALKLLRGAHPDEVARFQREARTAGKLSHPNIAAIHEFGETEGRHWIAMQFIPGKALQDFPRHDRRVLVRILRDAARAIAYAHTEGVVHRDLKPQNLMVVRTRGEPHVFVMDFGLARPAGGAGTLSVPGMILGTPAYMPPEQARGGRVDERSDVWSLGVTLYELLTDRKPFRAATPAAVLRMVQERDPEPLRRVNPKIDRDLETIVLKCLEKERARRYADAEALARDLDRWLKREAIQARAPSLAYRGRKWIGRHRTLVAALALGLAGAALPLAKWSSAEHAAGVERKLRETVELYLPLEHRLDMLRMNFYRPGYRLGAAELDRFRRLARDIEDQMTRTGPTAAGWFLVARCREVQADLTGADRAYAEALALDPLHSRTLIAWGRMRVERALFERRRNLTHETPLLIEEATAAAELIDRGAAPAEPESEMERDLGLAYRDLVRNLGKGPFDASALAAKWRGRPFAEEFLLLEAIGQDTHEKVVSRTTEVISRMASLPSAYYWRANARWKAGDLEGAVADCTRAVEINPGFVEAYNIRGNARADQGRIEEAAADYAQALEVDPRHATALNNRGTVRVRMGDLRGAVADFDQALRIHPRFSRAYVGRGLARRAEGNLQAAIEDFSRALDLDPDFDQAWVERGSARIDFGQPEAAVADLDRAIEINPGRADGPFHRARAFVAQNRQSRALEDYSAAIRINPRFFEAYNNRGYLRLTTGDPAGAVADLTRALEIDPGSAKACNNRGSAYMAAGEVERAIGDFTRALEIDPGNAPAFRNRGVARAKARDLRGAIDDFTRAIALNPGFLEAFGGRAQALLESGDVEGAIRDGERMLELAPPDWPERQKLKAHLRRLRERSR